MKEIKDLSKFTILVTLLLLALNSCSTKEETVYPSERVKVALRSVGNQLLLSKKDSTSLVLPVVALSNNTYELSFENPIAFDPSILNRLVDEIFKKANLPENYLVEVVQCGDNEVAYSYEMFRAVENNIVPCGGRIVPERCYTIELTFTEVKATNTSPFWFYTLVFLVLAFLFFVFYSKYHSFKRETISENTLRLGSFKFYPEENKLVKEAQDIPLSNKECELLAILISRPNQIVKREELSKKVWEDNGVIVGRSLDTYISKLRKKLQDDNTIKIVNVHGVGYKLELDK
ncbi:winged helix-turn-helix domain-containing protein [Patiriisocius marinus]|uniref:OmpR/PhoB-type domain-containing protein n=1 Tax=Patiriisocius marinus TaxID=1397112 RepID=A0A5J4IX91_9FLAO|nr:winged helix-turn-helix domain-containing protein [Patiriisocius marinus]GER59556.1 hypothetical protein ULMA_16640 [Patiriisocius marinus]